VFLSSRLHLNLMKERAKWLSGAVRAVLVCAAAHASAHEDLARPYDAIALRNVFALVAEQKHPVVEPVRALPKVELTGIATVLGQKLALLKAQFPAKPGEAAREFDLLLAEGQHDHDIEVVQIEEKAGRVKLNISGTAAMLTFAEDGVK